MTLTLNLSDEQAAALQIRADAEGLSVEQWIQNLPELRPSTAGPLQAAAEIMLSSMREVPAEFIAAMPTDGASQHDHYTYGWPKRVE